MNDAGSSSPDEYQVEAIRAWRWHKRNRTRMFFIKWIGYEESENTWEPEANLSCPDLLRRFYKKLSESEKLRYDHLDKQLSGFDRHAEFLGCQSADGPAEDDKDSDRPVRNRLYCLVQFDDVDQPEELSLSDFTLYDQEAALTFCESRLMDLDVYKRKCRDDEDEDQ